MKNVQDVLREKEAEIEKLNREIKLLRVAARILEDEGPPGHADSVQRHVETAAMNLDELEVAPVSKPANGEFNKRWP
jgi:hypothetical protein